MRNTFLIIVIIAGIVYNTFITRDMKDWQKNWETNGELPLDREQNARLDRLEDELNLLLEHSYLKKQKERHADSE